MKTAPVLIALLLMEYVFRQEYNLIKKNSIR